MHNAKKQREQRKYLKYSSEKQNGIVKSVYYNFDGSINSVTYN